ncbi:uncharacterized protein LOC127706031 [Mytilus californianus]|uniref:uncharacterized protein LOC127706031 n=1 Tax=Mytilus californianus TaxID=6549 RepID=UPI0022484415|nr:uncharacterized protein LOC127706031 [Mytilus californianus]XP_052066384.1 uncharacterized protein LOC127706031 [Mytilus californianus]
MAANYCEPCTARGLTPTAFRWCSECDEALCSECTEAHKVQKITRNHHLVETSKIPERINLSYNCSKHEHLPLDFFCVNHDVMCCQECLPQNHRSCKNVTSIDLASKNSKQSQSFIDFEEHLSFVIEALYKLNSNCKENDNRIEQQETKIRKQIEKIKEHIIKQLESLEESLLKDLTVIKDKIITRLKRQEKDIGDLITSSKAEKESLEFVRDHGSEKQAFVSIHSSKPVLDEIENKVKQLSESLAYTSLTFVESVSKEKITDLGSIELTETPCSFPFVPFKQCQSQVPVVLKRPSTSYTYLHDIDTKGDDLKGVTGITISDNNTLIFCDVNAGKIYFCDDTDNFLSSISSPFKPWNIAAIPGTTTAVMSGRTDPYVRFLDITKRRLSKKVKVGQSGSGSIAVTKDNIFVTIKGKIQVLDLSGKVKRIISLKHEQAINWYISVCQNGNICYSSGNAVHCITSVGCPVFSYSSSDLLYARNAITDDADNIYVLDCESSNIHKLTSTGNLVDILWDESLSEPYVFCFSKDFSKIYIANKKGRTVSVFKKN